MAGLAQAASSCNAFAIATFPSCSNFGRKRHFAFWAPFEGLGPRATYTVHLRLIGKCVVDFLLILIELFLPSATAKALWAKIKSAYACLQENLYIYCVATLSDTHDHVRQRRTTYDLCPLSCWLRHNGRVSTFQKIEISTSEVQQLQKFCCRNCWVFMVTHKSEHQLIAESA